jgi:ATP-dependent DNA helicase DinG
MRATMDLVEATFKEDGILSKKFDGYSVRPQQVELSKKIQESLHEKQTLLGEAPTGVGKSLAALVPVYEYIMKTGKPVVVVTSNIVLQEQYFYKDIPLLQELFGYDASPTLIKGRSNYLCPLKYVEYKASNANKKADLDLTSEIMDWVKVTQTGDVSELSRVPDGYTWGQFAVQNNFECLRKQCPLLDKCFYYKQRAKVPASKLIVCNYHYYFNALETPGLLPDEIGAVIMDEGHEIAHIARSFQERRYNKYSIQNIMNTYAKTCQLVKQHHTQMDVDSLLEDLDYTSIKFSLDNMLIDLSHVFKQKQPQGRDAWVIETKEDRALIEEVINHHIKEVKRGESSVLHSLIAYGLPDDERASWHHLYSDADVRLQTATESVYEQLGEHRMWLEAFVSGEFVEGDDENEIIQWIQTSSSQTEIELVSKPTKAKGITENIFADNKTLYGNTSMVAPPNTPVIVLSATLTVGSNFEHIKKDLGITENYDELTVTSPFDLTSNMLWYLPSDIPAGPSQDHPEAAFRYMSKIGETLGGKTLCLFTSNRNLVAGTNYLRNALAGKGIEVISQQELPKQKIIKRMKENPNVVVTATKSFFTGVDIQGQNLSAVLIDKIPFPMIGDPVNDHLTSKPHGFWRYALPEAIITLKQGFGRLNRTSSDRGIVAVLDGRLSTSNYKNVIFDSFDFDVSATRDWERVEAYLKELC